MKLLLFLLASFAAFAQQQNVAPYTQPFASYTTLPTSGCPTVANNTYAHQTAGTVGLFYSNSTSGTCAWTQVGGGGGSGLSVSGYYLTDGTNFFCGPVFTNCTKPVSASWTPLVSLGTGQSTNTTGGALSIVTTSAASSNNVILTTPTGAATSAKMLIRCTATSNIACGHIGVWSGSSAGGNQMEAMIWGLAGVGGGSSPLNAVVASYNASGAITGFLSSQFSAVINPAETWVQISISGGTCTYSFSPNNTTYSVAFSHACSITPANFTWGIQGNNSSTTLLNFP